MSAEQAHNIEVLESGTGWVVRFIEHGESFEREFDLERHARSFAEGQRLRIDISKNNSSTP